MDYTGYGAMTSAVNIDTNRLLQLGFTKVEIQQLNYVYTSGGKFTPSALQQYGFNYEQSKKLSYMYNICCGKVQINSKEETIRHLRRMFGSNYRISIHDLAVSKIAAVPRWAVVGGIMDEPYNIWNSNKYKGSSALYNVVDVSGQKVTVETNRKPRLEYKQSKSIPGVLDIKGVKNNGNVIVTFDKKYCKICNRFIIIASLRNPEFHLGKYEMLCFEGTRVYIYATNMGTKENIKYSMGNQRVYDFGIYPNDIKLKVTNVAKAMYQHLHGVGIQYEEPNMTYKVVGSEKEEQEELSNDIIM